MRGGETSGKPRVAVLGGGVCGLYGALVLSRAGYPVTVLEKEKIPGGLATSYRFGENYYDLGVHMLHSFDREVFEDVKGLMGRERVEVKLDARIRWAESYYRYPLQFQDMIKGMSLTTLAYYVGGLFHAQIQKKLAPWEPANAEEALIQMYGRPLYRYFFEEFTHRYWGIPPAKLSASFVTRKMPRLSAFDVVRKAMAKVGFKEKPGRMVESAVLDEILHYARTGAEALPRCLARGVESGGGKVVLEAEVEEIVIEENRVVGVRYRSGEGAGELECDTCISTIPVTELIRRIRPAAPEAVVDSAGQLRFKPIVIYGLLVKKERAMECLYIYYRNRSFHRVGEPKNAGLKVEPAGHTVLIVEMTCELGDEKWEGAESVRERILVDLEEEGICRPEEVVETHVIRNPFGYPVFSLGFEEHFDVVRNYVDGIANLQTTGRQGGFTYPNMHSAMRMGADAAEVVIRGGRAGEGAGEGKDA